MATDLGTRIRRARERKHLSQQELADAVGVSRSAVNAWENNRAEPRSSLGALEVVLDVNLSDGTGVESSTDPDEAVIMGFTQFSAAEKAVLVDALRRARRGG